MSFSAKAEDRLAAPQGDPRQSASKNLLVSCAASLAINAVFLLVMIQEIAGQHMTTSVQETPVEVIVETSPPETVEPDIKRESQENSTPPSRAGANERLKNGSSLREIADEERQQNAPRGEQTISGAGTDKILSGSSQEPGNKRESEDTPPDPNKEISRLIPPVSSPPLPSPRAPIAPPGPPKQLAARRRADKTATQNETTMKEKKIECGANARLFFAAPPHARRGQVLGLLTQGQATKAMQINQANYDLHINPNYASNIRIFVHVDGTPEGAFGVALLPAGLSVRIGDRVEYLTGRVDPSMPCHYIPPLVSRVL